MANGMLVPILKQISEKGIREFISEMAPDLDINGMILSMVQDSLKGGMQLELGSGIGRDNVSYRNGGIQLSPSGTSRFDRRYDHHRRADYRNGGRPAE